MTITNMQQPMQMQAGLGSLQDPRQNYGLGSFVKKAIRGVKKVAKSPLGKMALLGGGAYLAGGFMPGGGGLTGGWGNFRNLGSGIGGLFRKAGARGATDKGGFLRSLVRKKLDDGTYGGLSMGKLALGGLGAASLAPLFMGGDNEEVEEQVSQLDPIGTVQSAKNYYSGLGDKGVGLNYMPKKKYVDQNFYAADGGRANYAGGQLVAPSGDGSRSGYKGDSNWMDGIIAAFGKGMGNNIPKMKKDSELTEKEIDEIKLAVYATLDKPGGGPLEDQSNFGFASRYIDNLGDGLEQFTRPDLGNYINDFNTKSGIFAEQKANGGRIGYAGGEIVEDEEEFTRTNAGMPFRMKQTFLNMGGGAGEAQAEQMLMAEFIKYKNKGGDLSFQEFVQAVMQQQQQAQGMEQPMMAANGGRIGYRDGTPPKTNFQTWLKNNGHTIQSLMQPEELGLLRAEFLREYGADYAHGGRTGYANGGIMETEASEMIDMGGQEKDYRDEGGFVELGGEERADDVPARLSKNEFVFTADAVRQAGGGDIDEGSAVMQNLMDNLEQGGQVSEDSQGLNGGEEMMSEEEIIEEPNGAQAMYEQQQALQSRMI